MHPLTRFGAAAASAAVAALIPGLASLWSSRIPDSTAQDTTEQPVFQDPTELVSQNGLLEATFSVENQEIEIAGQRVTGQVYNGQYIPPTLRVRQGDTLRLRLINRLDEDTNLHYHGTNVSPRGNSDNVFVHVPPEQEFNYELKIGAQHPQGLFYYHPHEPGSTEQQIMRGMTGLLVVEGLLDPFPELKGITERQMVLKNAQIEDGAIPEDIDVGATANHTINGLVNPRIDIRPGELQLWRIGNLGADQYYQLSLDGHAFYEIARDGNRHNQLVTRTELLIPPSSRIEVLVRGGAPGRYAFKSADFDTGPAGDQYSGATLGTLVVGGEAVEPTPLPSNFPPVEDLRKVPNPPQRTIVFSETSDGNTFFINGKEFDHDRTDTTVRLGATEEWTIKNCSQELHVFHIHQLDFQVTEINGAVQPFEGYQDTINVPAATGEASQDEDCETGTPGVVKVLIPFTNPEIVGKFVYHCHIGEHEDKGMMATIEVQDSNSTAGTEEHHR